MGNTIKRSHPVMAWAIVNTITNEIVWVGQPMDKRTDAGAALLRNERIARVQMKEIRQGV